MLALLIISVVIIIIIVVVPTSCDEASDVHYFHLCTFNYVMAFVGMWNKRNVLSSNQRLHEATPSNRFKSILLLRQLNLFVTLGKILSALQASKEPQLIFVPGVERSSRKVLVINLRATAG